MTMLLMGRDTASGRLTLDQNAEARLVWPYRDNRRLYTAEGQVARWIARALGGRMTPSPTWRYLRQAVTVHNLGGVPMGDIATDSVVDTYGQVHGHPGLYVVDGAVIPSATGVNPSATIAAVAERTIAAAIRTFARPLARPHPNAAMDAPGRDRVVEGIRPHPAARRHTIGCLYPRRRLHPRTSNFRLREIRDALRRRRTRWPARASSGIHVRPIPRCMSRSAHAGSSRPPPWSIRMQCAADGRHSSDRCRFPSHSISLQISPQ